MANNGYLVVAAAVVATAIVGTEAVLAAEDDDELAVTFGVNATGADVRIKLKESFEMARKALQQKKATETLSDDERELFENLGDENALFDGITDDDLESIAALASGRGITIGPDAEARESGAKSFTITAADLAMAQEEATRMSEAAEAFAASEGGRSLESAARMEEDGGRSRRGDARIGASPMPRRSGGGSGSVWPSANDSAERRIFPLSSKDAESLNAAEDVADGMPFSTNSLDAVDFEILDWKFGGFHPATNCVCSAVEISGLKMSRDGLGFKYISDLSGWGYSYGDYSGALACLFVCDNDGKWVGGKFDWISSSRNTRDFNNVYGGYNGWSLANVPNPCPVAFVIVSADGKKRSNVITAVWER